MYPIHSYITCKIYYFLNNKSRLSQIFSLGLDVETFVHTKHTLMIEFIFSQSQLLFGFS